MAKSTNRRYWYSIIISIIVVIICIYIGTRKSSRKFRTISIVSIVKIDPITQLEEGFKKVINNSEFAKNDSVIITYDNAQGDASLQNQIVDKIIRNKPDLVYVLGTPIAIAIQKRDPNLTIVQGTVTDPVEAGLANSWESSGKNYTGTTDLPPVDVQIKIIKELLPNMKSLGIVYNTGEVNSVAVVKRLRNYIKDNNLTIKLEERAVSNTSEISLSTESLKNKVDAIYLPPDNTVHAGIKVLCKIASNYNIPVFSTVESSISEGALCALSLDYFKLGEESAEIALLILEGKKKASEIPIKPNSNPKIIINKTIADKYKIDLSLIQTEKNIEIR